MHRLRRGPSLTPAALGLDFGVGVDLTSLAMRRRFEAMCRLAKPLTVAVLTIQAAPLDTPFGDEVKRLTALAGYAMREGLVLAVETHSETLTADPAAAVALCKAVPGLGLTLDPSHYIQAGHKRRFRRRLSLRPKCPPSRHRQEPWRVPGPRRPGRDRVRPDRQPARTPRLRPRADRCDPRPARQPVRHRGRGPQAQAPAGEPDLNGGRVRRPSHWRIAHALP